MYQSNTEEYTEKDFEELVKEFEITIYKHELPIIPTTFEMDKTYTPNYACFWNKPKNIGKPCKILQHNDKLALVVFIDITNKEQESLNIIHCLYRVEDLQIIRT